jgi:hypothetical protein
MRHYNDNPTENEELDQDDLITRDDAEIAVEQEPHLTRTQEIMKLINTNVLTIEEAIQMLLDLGELNEANDEDPNQD